MTGLEGTEATGEQVVATENHNIPTGQYVKFHLNRLDQELTRAQEYIVKLEAKLLALDREFDLQIEGLKKKLMKIEKQQTQESSFSKRVKNFLMRKQNAKRRTRTKTSTTT